MRHGSLFSGIGGFDLAAEWMGWENVFHCEWNEFGQKVLKHYWPNAIQYHDITQTDFTIHRGRIDIITGGFPCQPYSMAGKRKGKEDERHLWPEMLRAITEIQPRWVVGENVLGLVNWNGGLVFHEVQADLEAAGYEVWPYVLPACAVNAPHRRDRVWFVAYATRSSKGTDKLRGIRCSNGEISGERSQTIYDAIGSDGVEGPTPDPNGNGQHECNGNDEINASEGRLDAQRDPLPGNGDGDAADTANERREKRKQNGGWKNASQNRTRMELRPQRLFDNGDAADSGSFRLQGGIQFGGDGIQRWDKQSKFIAEHIHTRWRGIQTKRWEDFPTESPICSRNDGLSSRLDGITFSKWRNESIKAAGNAIVPQVVYQIFKAIEQYERSTNPARHHPETHR